MDRNNIKVWNSLCDFLLVFCSSKRDTVHQWQMVLDLHKLNLNFMVTHGQNM